jgi:hypothetical protein
MSGLFPRLAVPPGGDRESTEFLDPFLEVREERQGWTLQAVRWRARELAEAIFGDDVPVSVEPGPAGSSARLVFQGLLRLSVPFEGLAHHRARECLFTACAADDPVLSAVPVIYVFDPDPLRVGSGVSGR